MMDILQWNIPGLQANREELNILLSNFTLIQLTESVTDTQTHTHAPYTVSKKKGATGFFAVTFTNIDGFS